MTRSLHTAAGDGKTSVTSRTQHAAQAWYAASRDNFLAQAAAAVTGDLSSAAARQGWVIEPEQHEEWERSVSLLQARLRRGRGTLDALSAALRDPAAHDICDVVLEYDLRRRGLRIDCVLLAPGAVLVVEFKRNALDAAARDQVMGYCTSLVEFHEATQRVVDQGAIVVPILVQTKGARDHETPVPDRLREPFAAVLCKPLLASADTLGQVLADALDMRGSRIPVERRHWVNALFHPSSNIVDAAVSLYGEHDVSAIRGHAAPVAAMARCTEAVKNQIDDARRCSERRLVFVSGAPGAGKTLVGLELAFDPTYRTDAVFVTGNAPLVDVLDRALRGAYERSARTTGLVVASGYAAEHARIAIDNSTFKLVKAHQFLGQRGARTASTDGALLVFDEAQRTYKSGRRVLGHALPDHEADLILKALEDSYPRGVVVVALLGQNQAINRGERGSVAWLEAAERRNWRFAISDETLSLPDLVDETRWREHALRLPMPHGHLHHSMRFYRNAGLEQWAHHILEDDIERAAELGAELDSRGDTIWLTRDLEDARTWARRMRVGEERCGLIASGQARRLAALGLHVDLKPNIAEWMLAPTGDFRSSNTLETVQNQYQIQGLELDWTIVCWGADLRRCETGWSAHRLSGSRWQRDSSLDVACNGYRVLLTRARKGMVVFVPRGDLTRVDATRDPSYYDETAAFLLAGGARLLGEPGNE